MKTVTKAINAACTVMGFLGGGLLCLMMLFTTYDVVQRMFTRSPLVGTTELITYAFCAMLYSSYCFTQIRHSHIHMTIVAESLPGRAKFVLWALTSILGAATSAAMVYATYLQAMQQVADNTYTMMLRIPFAPLYILCFVAMILFAAALLLDAAKAVLAIFNEDYAREVAKACFIKQN